MNLKKIVYLLAGCVSFGLGALGAVMPVIPTVPFLMLSAFCFARSSEKLHRWFVDTKLYKDNLADFVAGRGMTRKTKIRIMVTVTILMSIGFVMMQAVPVGRIVLGCVWLGTPRLSRGAQYCWWAVTMLSQCGWVYLVL